MLGFEGKFAKLPAKLLELDLNLVSMTISDAYPDKEA